MNVSTPKNFDTSNSNSSTSNIRYSYLKPPQIESRIPTFLQQTRVSLYIPKHDNDLPDYNNSLILINDEQRSVRSLTSVSRIASLEVSNISSNKNPGFIRKDTLLSKSPKRSSETTSNRGRSSTQDQIDIFQESDKKREKRFLRIERLLADKWFNIFLTLLTVYALLGQDISLIIIPKDGLIAFDVLGFICISLFFAETLLNFLAYKEYRWSFFFWLDVISTLSMLLDISFVPSGGFETGAENSSLTGASQISKIGARAGRAVRLVRIVKLYKQIKKTEFMDAFLGHPSVVQQTRSFQSLTNLVDTIAKLKKHGLQSQQTTRRFSLEPKKLKTLFSNNFKKEKGGSGQKMSELEVPSLESQLPYMPRRLSKFAYARKVSDPSSSNQLALIKKTSDQGLQNQNAKKPPEQSFSSHLAFIKRQSDQGSSNQLVFSRKLSDQGSATLQQKKKLDPAKSLMTAFTMKEKMAKERQNNENNLKQQPKESRVGKKLSELITKKVIVIVIILVVIIPFFSTDAWVREPKSYISDVKFLKQAYRSGMVDQDDIDKIINDFIDRYKSTQTPLLYFQVPNGTVVYNSDPPYTEYKKTDIEEIGLEDEPRMLLVVNLSLSTKVTAALSIGRTIFICFILAFGAWKVSKDTSVLVLRPLERMIEKVNRIAVAPLSVKREHLMDEIHEKETILLENALTKIGTLLALGFGDAGAGIIAQNIAMAGDMNPMLLGEKIMAIFGFCDIRNFTDVTEVLQEDVMVFVNSIADIVHDKVDKYGGSANKNIGDAFLLVWKFPHTEIEEMDDELQLKNSDLVKGLADFSLFSFLKIYAKINQSHILRKYRTNSRILERLPNFRVKMGFGLHVGWAIEGAIGSEFKIDASYLSPNVNIASRLEAATKQYGVPLLISSDLYVLFSDEVQNYCRKVDVVTVKGSTVPITLYTVDLESSDLRDKGPSKRTKKERVSRHEAKKTKLFEMILDGKLSSHLLFERDKDIKLLMKNALDTEFRTIWDEGIEAFIQGNWKKARLSFDKCLALKEVDGPSFTLLNYIKNLGYLPPENWRGFRELTEK